MLLFIHWAPDPTAFHVFGWPVKWYGILWGTGIFSTFLLGTYVMRTLHRSEEKLVLLIQYIFIGGLIGARLAQVIFYQPEYFLANPLKIFAVWEGGLASHGGLIGGTVGLLLFCRKNKDYSVFWTIDHAAIVVLFLSSFIRFGNLMNSELEGTATHVPWAFIFTNIDNVPRHPVVLYESLWYFIVQLVQLYLFNRFKDERPGLYTTVFFIMVFVVRFALEFLKVPEGNLFAGCISKTQLLDVPFIITGFAMLYLVLKRKLHYNNLGIDG